jgi:hypothetical protein
MRRTTTAALLAACMAAVTTAEARDVGMGVLMIWPTARSTALAGAMTGLADEADAAYYNPAGLAIQTTPRATITHDNWLPDLYRGMRYASAEAGVPLNFGFLHGRNAFIAGSAAYLRIGRMLDLYHRSGSEIRQVCPSRGDVAAHAAMMLSDRLAVGLGAKLLVSQDAIPPWPYL